MSSSGYACIPQPPAGRCCMSSRISSCKSTRDQGSFGKYTADVNPPALHAIRLRGRFHLDRDSNTCLLRHNCPWTRCSWCCNSQDMARWHNVGWTWCHFWVLCSICRTPWPIWSCFCWRSTARRRVQSCRFYLNRRRSSEQRLASAGWRRRCIARAAHRLASRWRSKECGANTRNHRQSLWYSLTAQVCHQLLSPFSHRSTGHTSLWWQMYTLHALWGWMELLWLHQDLSAPEGNRLHRD